MLLVEFEVRPGTGTEVAARFRGAFVNAWADFADCAEAVAAAQKALLPDWVLSSAPECRPVEHSDIPVGATEYYDQALTDQLVVVLHTYLLEEVNEDEKGR